MAAVLACGTGPVSERADFIIRRWGAAVSHRSAAALWGLLPGFEGHVDVSVPSEGGRRSRRGIRLHRCPSLRPEQVTSHEGIPVTTPARTIFDLRRMAKSRDEPGLGLGELRRAIRQAEVLGLRVEDDVVLDGTRSELELLFLRLCVRHDVPAPEVNVRLGPWQVDFLWRDRKLVVETDGYQYHRGRAAFENDRLSYRQVLGDPASVAEVLTRVLGSRGSPPSRQLL